MIAILFQSGCASMAVDGIGSVDGGSADADDRIKAGLFDVVTLPVQVPVIAGALLFMPDRDRDEKKISLYVQEIKKNHSLIISEKLPERSNKSIEYRALIQFLADINYLEHDYLIYIHNKASKRGAQLTRSVIRSKAATCGFLEEIYNEFYVWGYNLPYALTENKKLPKWILEETTDYRAKSILIKRNKPNK